MKLVLLLPLLILPLFAQERLNLDKDEVGATFTQDELERLDSIDRGTVLKRRDIETGIFLKDYNTYTDKNRTSFLAHVNNDIGSITDVVTLEFNYAHRFELAWLELFALRTAAKFGEISDNNASDFASSGDLLGSEDVIYAVGAGITYRSNWVQTLVDSDKMFTTTSAAVGWYTLDQNLIEKSFSGPGLKTDFGLHRRASRSMHYGVRMSYHVASVKRAQEFDTETSSRRALTLSWLSWGFDLSFYF